MTSIRFERAQDSHLLEEKLASIRAQQDQLSKEAAALEQAASVLAETPRTLTPTEITLEYHVVNTTSEIAHCGECLRQYQGYTSEHKFCPLCGSSIQSVTREDSPFERMTHNAVNAAMNAISK